MSFLKQPNLRNQWIHTPIPKLNTYYVMATSSVWRLIWVNRMGRVYRYDFQSQEFVRDDIVDVLESDWYLYSQIVLKETENFSEAKAMIEPEITRYNRKKTLELVLLPFTLLVSVVELFVVLPLKSNLRKIKRIFFK